MERTNDKHSEENMHASMLPQLCSPKFCNDDVLCSSWKSDCLVHGDADVPGHAPHSIRGILCSNRI
jgi:hypothetical protein